MSHIAKYSLNKLIVLWTVLLLFTPCTTKQSLKSFLGLPVSTLYTVDQANKLRNCSEIRQGSDKQVAAYSTQKQLKHLLLSHQAFLPAIYKQPGTIQLPDLSYGHQAYTVPIYIFHDQLLI